MSYPKVTEAIQAFLNAKTATHNDPGLIARWSPMMETQVNVAAGKGTPVDGKRSTYTDGSSEWWNIRMPKNANSDPEFKDYALRWPLELHVDAIGCTGWDWAARRSRWVGFDFDSITGHAKGVGITPEELTRVKEAAQAIPWVEVRKSTGGNGLHLYVYFETDMPIENHTVHAALGRTVLGMMSSEASFDFASHIDACGGNMWIWARKMTAHNEGLKLLKPAERSLVNDDIPQNWRDNIEVVTRRRTKVRVDGITDDNVDPFEALASSRRIVPLDSKHKAIIDALRGTGYTAVWVPDHHMLQTHTGAFALLMEEKKKELGLVGFFETISESKDRGTQNCFAFPLDNGGWRVYLYGPGRPEAKTWEQDGQGWTTCYFNRAPDLKVASRASGGVEDAEKGGFIFDHAKEAIEAANALGQKITLPDDLLEKEARLKRHKDGRLVMQIEKGDESAAAMKRDGWSSSKKSPYWSKVFEARVDSKAPEVCFTEYENIVRALVTPVGSDAGWYHKSRDGERWLQHSTEKVNLKLLSRGVSGTDLAKITGTAIDNPWTLVNLPFQPEYPGGRQWNYDAAQLKYKPAELKDDEVPYHPHWDAILKHLGRDLDEALQNLEWARAANITTGRDYLLAWTACLLREPFQPLPYLFFYSPKQNNGKSSFHEALQLLITKGATPADRALTASNDFNGELANAVLAYIEEKDISKSPGAYNRIKDWVTSPMLAIRKMRTDAYTQPNTLHFIQTANDRDACPVFPGDTRITMVFVSDFQAGQEIPREILKQHLRDEAPHFMRTIIDLQLPPVMGRLRLPVVNTDNKQRAEDLNKSPLEAFIESECYEVPGHTILFSEFFERFQAWLSADDHKEWHSKRKIIRSLPQRIPFGSGTDNKRFVGNISWENVSPKEGARPLVAIDNKLVSSKAQ